MKLTLDITNTVGYSINYQIINGKKKLIIDFNTNELIDIDVEYNNNIQHIINNDNTPFTICNSSTSDNSTRDNSTNNNSTNDNSTNDNSTNDNTNFNTINNNVTTPINNTNDEIIMTSFTNPYISYTCNINERTCTCPDFEHRHINATNPNYVCKHLRNLLNNNSNTSQRNNNTRSKAPVQRANSSMRTNTTVNNHNIDYTNIVRSSTNSSVQYYCNTRIKTCTCPDFEYRHNNYNNYICKHLRNLLND